MAKTTRPTTKKPGPVAVLDPPEHEDLPETAEEPTHVEDDTPEPSAEAGTVVNEVADKQTLDARRGRGATKEGSVGFFPRLTRFSPAEWERTMLYVYRLAPITDRMATGNRAKYISKYGQPIDEETILKDHGSGSYRITLNQSNKEGQGICLDRIEIEIENVKYPPVVPLGEWVDDPRNKRWAWARTGANAPPGAAAPAAPPAPAGPTIGELIQGVKSLKELTKEAAPPPPPPGPDPAEQFAKNVDSVSKIIEMAKPAAAPAPDNAMEKFLLSELAAERAANRELMGKLLDRANAPVAAAAADPLKDLAMDLLKKRMEKMDEAPTAEAIAERASRMNGTQELIAEGFRQIGPVLEKALTLITVGMAAKQQQQPQPRPTPRPAPAADQPAVEQAQPQQQQSNGQADAPPVAEQVDPRKAVLNFILSYVTPTLISYLEANDGEGFANWFCNSSIPVPKSPFPIPGMEAHKFAKQFGRVAIMEAYKTNPELYKQIAPNTEAEERFIRFLDEFLAYDPEAEGGDDEA